MRLRKIYVSKLQTHDVGLAALLMVLKSFHQSVSVQDLQAELQKHPQKSSLESLQKTAQHLGLKAQIAQADWHTLDHSTLVYPWIAHVVKGNNVDYYYVILRAKKKYLLVADPDPQIGITRLSYKQFYREWTGNVLLIAPSNPPLTTSFRQLVISLITRHKLLTISLVIAALLEIAITVLTALAVEQLIDTYWPQKMLNTTVITIIGLMVAYLFQAVFHFLRHLFLEILDQHWTLDLILGLVQKLLNISPKSVSNHNWQQIVLLFNEGVTTGLKSGFNLLLDGGMVILLGIILAIQNSWLFVAALLILPITVLLSWWLNHRQLFWQAQQLDQKVVWNTDLHENLTQLETITTLGIAQQRYQKFDHDFTTWMRERLGLKYQQQKQQALQLAASLILSGLTLLLGSFLVWKNLLTIGQLVAFTILLFYFLALMQMLIKLQQSTMRWQKIWPQIKTWQQTQSFSEITNPAATKLKSHGRLTCQDVSFHYHQQSDLIKNLNLELPPQTKIAIVGRSGSGKSTLGRLLAGLEMTTTGQVQLDGHNLAEVNPQVLQQQISYVTQVPQFFTGTLAENLQLGSTGHFSPEEIRTACQIVNLTETIENLPQKYQTVIDANASLLSGGQKQQLLLAQTILAARPIVILDAAFNALDTLTQNRIWQYFLHSQQTVIVMTPNLELARKINNIAVLQAGSIKELGTQRELIKQQGEYYRLFKAARGKNYE